MSSLVRLMHIGFIEPSKPYAGVITIDPTVAPRTIDRLVGPALEAHGGRKSGQDSSLARCPGRVMPGRLLRSRAQMSRVVGGGTPEAAQLGLALHRHVVEANLDLTDCVTAELVKTAKGAYRDVQIGSANELVPGCE